jgi:hypothetical protein
MVTPRAQRDQPGVGPKGFEYPHGALPTEDAHLRGGEAGVFLLAETPVVPAPYGLKLNCRGETHRRLAVRRGLPAPNVPVTALAVGLAQHPDQHRPKDPVFLAVEQELGEGPGQSRPGHETLAAKPQVRPG